jgi:glycerate kinase
MRILVAPNSFKGSLSSIDAARAIASGLRRSGLGAACDLLPLADGGDGTLDAFLVGGGQRIVVDTVDALGRPIQAAYGLLDEGRTAVIEMALASGLARLARAEIGPESALAASTYGTGLLMRAALDAGVRRMIVGMGGSATTDGGAGCLQALGARLTNAQGQALAPGGGALTALHRIDLSGLDARWQAVAVIVASDVSSPALGEQGASQVFAPQKGAGAAQITQLEAGLTRFLDVLEAERQARVREFPGSGAAGAFAAGLMSCLGATIRSGVDLILDHHRFEERLRGASLVITGEGQLDEQSLMGKGPIGLARRAQAAGVPTVAIVGGLNTGDARLHQAGIAAVMPLVTRPMSLDEAMENAAMLMEGAALRLGYWLGVGADCKS